MKFITSKIILFIFLFNISFQLYSQKVTTQLNFNLPLITFTGPEKIHEDRKDKTIFKQIEQLIKEISNNIEILGKKTAKMHTLYFLIKFADKGEMKYFVRTGSHNLTKRSLRKNFEVMFIINSKEIYKKYLRILNR
ncbi:MAG: hypothetical protein KTR26_22265 [Flammeovirgaceae bacterium]|nr:hypothetical protein [Flammeovirgaceae bacterium]